MSTVNSTFGVALPQDPRACLLGALEEYEWEETDREAIHRVLFQARKLIMVHWRAEAPPTRAEWITNIGTMLRMEKLVYQHRGNAHKFERLWAKWLDVPGLAPVDLVMDRLLGINVG